MLTETHNLSLTIEAYGLTVFIPDCLQLRLRRSLYPWPQPSVVRCHPSRQIFEGPKHRGANRHQSIGFLRKEMKISYTDVSRMTTKKLSTLRIQINF